MAVNVDQHCMCSNNTMGAPVCKYHVKVVEKNDILLPIIGLSRTILDTKAWIAGRGSAPGETTFDGDDCDDGGDCGDGKRKANGRKANPKAKKPRKSKQSNSDSDSDDMIAVGGAGREKTKRTAAHKAIGRIAVAASRVRDPMGTSEDEDWIEDINDPNAIQARMMTMAAGNKAIARAVAMAARHT